MTHVDSIQHIDTPSRITELASDINDKKFLFSWVAFYTALTCGDTTDDFVPEEESAETRLASSWAVSTKMSCDALTSIVGASKPTLEEVSMLEKMLWS